MSTIDPTGSRSAALGALDNSQENPLRHYVAVLKRRRLWIVLGLVVGLAAGFVSTLFIHEDTDPTRYYRATHTLAVDASGAETASGESGTGTGTGASPDLQQAAFRIRSAEVTQRIVDETGLSTDQVLDQVTAFGRTDVQAVDVTAISTDPREAVRLANKAAVALEEFVTADAQTQFSAQRDAVLTRLDELKARRDQLQALAFSDPANEDLINAELDSVINQYRLTYDELQTLSAQGGPSGTLTTLQPATAVEINARAYSDRLNANRNALGTASELASQPPALDYVETELGAATPISKAVRLGLGAAAGLVMGLATAFLVEAWDDRIRRRERAEALTGLPVLAEVPKLTREQAKTNCIPAADNPRSRAAERYRSVRTSVLFALEQRQASPGHGLDQSSHGAPVIMIASPSPREGKTTTVANLAAMFADDGMRTLVIDCDYHRPSIAKYLQPVPDLLEPSHPAETRLDGVHFIAAPRSGGSAAVVGLLRQTIASWREQYDIVLLDTPPMLTTNDVADLLPAADNVVLVLRAGYTSSGSAERVANLLGRYHAEVLGIVLNSADSDTGSYYGSYYGYHNEENVKGRKRDEASLPDPDQAAATTR